MFLTPCSTRVCGSQRAEPRRFIVGQWSGDPGTDAQGRVSAGRRRRLIDPCVSARWAATSRTTMILSTCGSPASTRGRTGPIGLHLVLRTG